VLPPSPDHSYLISLLPCRSYHLVDETTPSHNLFRVRAAPISHTVPCVGYVVEDAPIKERNLRVEALREIVERNAEALRERYRVKERVYNCLRTLGTGESFTFPDGTVVHAEEVLHSPLPSRKIVVMGDTCNGEAIAPLASGADLLVHEATSAYFAE
jgi:ribonuclease Z